MEKVHSQHQISYRNSQLPQPIDLEPEDERGLKNDEKVGSEFNLVLF